ncbi:MAG: hypothetical protein Q7R30_18150 [Acidobacteriota bacterium]|nr:hypothetical protein [Acidobacteriota bacterium]
MDVQLVTIEALALAIEAKAGSTPEHIQSIQQYAATLGEAAGLSDAEVQAVRTAAFCTTSATWRCPSTSSRSPRP